MNSLRLKFKLGEGEEPFAALICCAQDAVPWPSPDNGARVGRSGVGPVGSLCSGHEEIHWVWPKNVVALVFFFFFSFTYLQQSVKKNKACNQAPSSSTVAAHRIDLTYEFPGISTTEVPLCVSGALYPYHSGTQVCNLERKFA